MFLISLLFVLISSYFITSCIMRKEQPNNLGFIYFLLICFSQIILSFEFLSLFSLINTKNFIITNVTSLLISFIYWFKSNKPLYKPQIYNEIKNIVEALKQDKLLFFISICFIIFLLSELFVALFFPITFGDALKYTFTRCTSWIQNGNINHFITPDTRELIMPVNLEFLYTWLFLFLKKENGTAIFSYISYLGSIYLIYNFLGELKFEINKRLWAIFAFSSFALIGVMAYTPCSDLFLGSLILSSIYLFYLYCKEENKIAIYFSSLAYAIAIGTKTTAIMMIPATSIIFLAFIIKFKKDIKKTILFFTIPFIFNLIIFSSYNYILNFLHYGNFISNNEQFLIHKFNGGFKGFLCNFIKYCFVLFDSSGIPLFQPLNILITNIQTNVLSLIGETPDSYMSPFFKDNFKYNATMTISTCALGVIGILTFIPSLFKAVKDNIKSEKSIILFILSLSFIINIIIISRAMLFSQYNIRYLAAFVVVTSPILAYSYIKSNKNIYKWIICLFMFVYLFGISHIKPVSFILKYINMPNSKNKYELVTGVKRDEKNIYNYLKSNKAKNIAQITNQQEQALFDIEKLKLDGIIINKILIENIEDFNLSKYDYIITDIYKTESTSINKYDSTAETSITNNFCLYINENAQIIEEKEKETPTKVICEIPFNYFESNNFYNINLDLNNYKLLKNKKG